MLSGCTSLKAVLAMSKSTDGFVSLKQDPRIKYEDDSINIAQEIAPYLDSAIQSVKHKQGLFKKTPIIYLPKSIENFSSYCGSKYPSGCVVGKRLFISPKLHNQKDRILSVLTHELSHLQLVQEIGFWNFNTNLPTWFKEGLAVYVSNGGGAEEVTPKEAFEAIQRGKSIKPNDSGSLLFKKTATSFGLRTHMFYRQSELYVKWLHDVNPKKFKELLSFLKQDKTFEETLISAYGFTVSQGWTQFIGKKI